MTPSINDPPVGGWPGWPGRPAVGGPLRRPARRPANEFAPEGCATTSACADAHNYTGLPYPSPCAATQRTFTPCMGTRAGGSCGTERPFSFNRRPSPFPACLALEVAR